MGGAYHCVCVNLSRQFESVSSFGVFACVWIFSVNLFSDYFHHPSTLHALLLLISSFSVFTFLDSLEFSRALIHCFVILPNGFEIVRVLLNTLVRFYVFRSSDYLQFIP